MSCLIRFWCFHHTYLNIHVPTDDGNVVFGNITDKEKKLVLEGDDVRFISGVGGSVVGIDCCAGVAVKCCYYDSLNVIE